MPESRIVISNTTPSVIDERLARRHADRLGLTITGTLGVLLKAKQEGYVSSIEPLISQLQNNGIRLSKPLVAKVLQLAGEAPE